MKVILEPTVTVIGHSQFIEHPIYKIPSDGDDSVKLCSFAAKGCYDSFGETGRPNKENQEAILEHRHGSVLEHYYITVFIEGITRALTLEMNRHRLLAISQRSTRYTKEEDAAIVLEPYYAKLWEKYHPFDDYYDEGDGWNMDGPINGPREDSEAVLLMNFLERAQMALEEYQKEVETLVTLNPTNLSGFDLRKWARGKARNILPHCLETRVTYTGNLRAWRWIIEARSNEHAEPEIRRLADKLLTALKTVAPLYFNDFGVTKMYDGIPVWVPLYHKV